MALRLIVTRPQAQAAGWVRQLRALGQEAEALPLIRIAPPADAAPVQQAWQRLGDFSLLMFVSANAVEHFFGHASGPWPEGLRAGSTGPGTTAALRAAGVPEACVLEPDPAAQRFDSEALWARLAGEPWAGRRVAVVRGEDGRDWFADTLRAAGARLEFIAAYRRLPPLLDSAQQSLLQQALADPARHLWLFSSSEAIAQLQTLTPGAGWAQAHAIASHPRIAAAARAAGFGCIALVPPLPGDVVAAAATWPPLQSWAP
jgi:uroporphyrinogen-III synthase